MRRLAGVLLIVAGTLLVGGVGWRYYTGLKSRDVARAAWQDVVTGPPVTATPVAAVTPGLPGTPVARVTIPRLGIDEVVLEGVTATELNAAPGHHPGTPLPGLPGNSVISAHRDRHFFALGKARLGDTIVTETRAGRVRWRIADRRIMPAEVAMLYQTAGPVLTLTTCWPIRYVGPAPDRLVLIAEPLDWPAPGPSARVGGTDGASVVPTLLTPAGER